MEATQDSTAQLDELDALWKQFEECPPVMTMEELEAASRMLFATEGARTVRAGLLTLTKSGRELLDMMHGGPEMVGVFEELADCARDRAERLRGVAEALDTAQTRLRMALCDAGEAEGMREAVNEVAP